MVMPMPPPRATLLIFFVNGFQKLRDGQEKEDAPRLWKSN